MLALAVLLSVTAFAIRIPLPPTYWTPVLMIQPAHLPQYIICYCLGMWARAASALSRLPQQLGVSCLVAGAVWCAGGWGISIVVAGGDWGVAGSTAGPIGYTLYFAFWEQFFAVSGHVLRGG